MLSLNELIQAAEVCYRNQTPELLSQIQNQYKHPSVAVYMARAFLMLGDVPSAEEFLAIAEDSGLKKALRALMALNANIENTSEIFLDVAREHPDLDYPDFWRTFAAVADAVAAEPFTRLAEQRSQALSWSDPNIHFNQALRMLAQKEYLAGWNLYEARLIPGCKNPNRTQLGYMPMWEGESLKDKSIVVYLEQGLGDCLFSLRYIKALREEGARVEIVARKPLLGLIASSFPDIKRHDEDDVAFVDYWQKTPACDFWSYSLSIPARSGRVEPYNCGSFASVASATAASLKALLEKENPRGLPVVAINWKGRVDTDSDRTRAYTPEDVLGASLFREGPYFLVSVQIGATEEEISQLKEHARRLGHEVFNASPFIRSFEDTAGFIVNSQRLVTCDTSVAHLGGALGHPTHVLLRNKAIWQWVVEEEDPQGPVPSLWYESVQVERYLCPEISWMFELPQRPNLRVENDARQVALSPQHTGAYRGDMAEIETHIRIHRESQRVLDNQGRIVAWDHMDAWPWKNNEVASLELGDLPCRMDKVGLQNLFSRVGQMGRNSCPVRLRLPHPRHDVFLADLDYQTAILPETLESLIATAGLPLEMVDVTMVLDPDWQEALEQKKVTAEEVATHARQAFNVIEWIEVELRVNHSMFRRTPSFELTPEMRRQLMEQMQMQSDRGNVAAVETINKFLNGIAP